LVTVRWLHIALLLAVCSCNQGPNSPVRENGPLFVTDFSLAPGVVVFAAGASGDVIPIRTLAGDNTALSNATGIARDAAGTLYVANPPLNPVGGGSITVYAAGASGDASPARTITGSNTGLNGPSDIAVDAARNVYVTNTGGYVANAGSVTVYAAGASGNVIPIRTIAGCNTSIG